MRAKALVSFAGAVVGTAGQEVVIDDKKIYDDLLAASYIEPIEDEKKAEKKTGKKSEGK